MCKLSLSLFFLIFLSLNVSSQDLKKSFNAIKKSINTVEVENVSIKPEFNFPSNSYGKVYLTINSTNSKGKSSMLRYTWNMADIDTNTIVRFVKGKIMYVAIVVKNKQKFIKKEKDEKISYVSKLTIPVNNADDAQVLIDELKTSISYANLGELKWNSFSSAMEWMNKNVSEQYFSGKAYTQSWNYFPNQNNKIVFNQLVTNSKGVSTENKYEFYINDLFENTVKFKISDNKLEIEIKTIGSKKLIKYSKNGEQANYVSSLNVLTDDIDLTRNMIIAIQTAISKFEVKKKVFKTVSDALAFIDSSVENISGNNETIEQSLKSSKSNLFKAVYTKKTINSKGTIKEETYSFYWDHINTNFITVDISGKNLYLKLKAKGNKKFISHITNNKAMSLTNSLKFKMNDLAIAREVIKALKFSIPLSKPKIPEFISRVQALNWLKENINLISINESKYEQLFEIVNSKYILNMNYSNTKGKSKSTSYEFYPFTLEKNLTTIEVKRKKVYLKLGVTCKNKYVRYIENGLLKSYVNKVKILCKDVIEAQIMKSAFTYLIKNTPKLKNFGSAKQAGAFLLNNVGKVEIPGITYNQSMSNKDGDNSVILYNYDKVSSKGKVESKLYELNLGYLYPDQIKLKAKGKKLYIEALTKGKQKLIKSYKNNELQNYTYRFIIQMNDVLAGLRMEIALKILAKEYEK
jgi:hypothetical protein